MKKNTKPVVYCGVVDGNDRPVKLTKEQQEEFMRDCSNGGKYEVVFCKEYTDMLKSMINDDDESGSLQ